MTSVSAYGSALQGIQRGLAQENKSASEIASKHTTETKDPTDLAKSFVELKAGVTQVQASVAVIKAVDKSLGKLFDELA